jgi:uncharacterized membrane protein
MNTYLKETALWAFLALPYVYLVSIWNNLPAVVPIHFNMQGVADDWSDRSLLWFMPAGLGIGIYLLMLIIPAIDPKKRIQQMGDKYYRLRFLLTVFISLLSIYLLYATEAGSLKNPHLLFALLGMLFAMLGNYFQTVRSNYFIGIRTPWTLESEEVWKKTHHLAGRLWMGGGILIFLFAFLVRNNFVFLIISGVLLFVMVIVPVVFSYQEYKRERKVVNE